MERFFSTVKREFADRFASFGEAKMQLFDYIEVFHNQRRRHSTLGEISPAPLGVSRRQSDRVRLRGFDHLTARVGSQGHIIPKLHDDAHGTSRARGTEPGDIATRVRSSDADAHSPGHRPDGDTHAADAWLYAHHASATSETTQPKTLNVVSSPRTCPPRYTRWRACVSVRMPRPSRRTVCPIPQAAQEAHAGPYAFASYGTSQQLRRALGPRRASRVRRGEPDQPDL